MKALLFGMLAGGLVAGGLAWVKKSQLEARARQIQADLESPTAQVALAVQARAMRQRLEQFAVQQAEAVARRSADAHLASGYGLTPERMRGIQALIQRFQPPRV